MSLEQHGKKKDKSTWIIVAIFCVAGFVAWPLFFNSYRHADSVSVHDFPRQIGEWKSIDLTILADEYAILGTRNVFARKYTNAQGKSVYLMVVYSQHNRKVSQPPEICYAGSGTTIVNNEHTYVDFGIDNFVVKANKMILETRNAKQIMYYWFKVGKDTFTASYWKQQLLIAAKTLLGKPASSAMIRVSVSIDQEKISEASQRIDEFVLLVTPPLFKFLP